MGAERERERESEGEGRGRGRVRERREARKREKEEKQEATCSPRSITFSPMLAHESCGSYVIPLVARGCRQFLLEGTDTVNDVFFNRTR